MDPGSSLQVSQKDRPPEGLLGESLHDQAAPLRLRIYQERLPGLSAVDVQEGGLGLVSTREYPAGASLFPPLGTHKIATPTLEAWWEILSRETPRPWALGGSVLDRTP